MLSSFLPCRPGLRERFVYHQHKYCSDKFWTLLAQHFRFVWPYDFRDCYVHNRTTGKYQLSDLFLCHLNDLTCFTFCKDMFQSFPEFECDIPKFMSLPPALDGDLNVKQLTEQPKTRTNDKSEQSMVLETTTTTCTPGLQEWGYSQACTVDEVCWAEPFLL